jgi:hypothetical protein
LVRGKGWNNPGHGRQKKCETVRSKEIGAPVNRIMAEAVLTPRNKDLKSGIWTRAAPLTSMRISSRSIWEKKKRSRLFASNEK